MKSRELEFLTFFVSMLKQGYDVDNILQLCQELHFKNESRIILDGLNKGESLSDILLKCCFSKSFNEYFSFFKNTFSISEAIEKTINICNKKKEMKNTLIKKMTYPFCMLIFMFIFSIFIASYLLPQVENLFRDFQIEKSLLIQIVFILFHIIPYFMFLSFLTIIFISIYVYRHVKKIDFKVIDFFIHRTHIISYFLKKYYSLKFAIYYDELLQNKYDVTSIVEILYKKIDDSDIKMIIYELYHMIYNGISVDDAIRQFDYFEEQFKFFYFMMNHSGGNKKSLKNYIDFVYMQIDLFLSKFVKIVVPLIYGFVASFVIIVYISIILPMMNIITIV